MFSLKDRVALVAGGCSILPFAAYLIKGISTPADYTGLKGKNVAVICRPVASLQYQSSSVASELAQRVGDLRALPVRLGRGWGQGGWQLFSSSVQKR